ncbi:zona pellucida sperm-binding protein 4-like [Rana temporaria]|uniref:zona pellucida sperm-binding protein 4-like n=1 Tax=Rana temporaria TaxID=8407 RepID=UPI001AACAB81|nr:zona pellucida sperm-binding protein 4-like [Rana temporaria]
MAFILVGVLWVCGFVSGNLDSWDDPSRLRCGYDYMQFSLPSLLNDVAFVLSVIDFNGKPHYLHNNSACGTWVGQDLDGSVMVGASFDSCFMKKEDGGHVMTISLEEFLHNGKYQYHKKDLKCPVLFAMDAPSARECSAIPTADRIPCANITVSRDRCESVGCCYIQSDPENPCYYGNKLTAQCTDGSMVVVVSPDLTVPSLILDSVSVVDVDSTSCPSFSTSKTGSFVGFRLPLSCSSVKQASDSMTYESTLVGNKEVQMWQGSSVTRDSTMRLTVRCSYIKTGTIPLEVEVLTLPPPSPVSTPGPLLLEMVIAKDGGYSSYYADVDYPVVKVLRDPVFLEVHILHRSDPNLVLILDNCWATNSASPTDAPKWPILFHSCPFPGDNYLSQGIPVGAPSQSMPLPTHYQRFMVSTFTFVAPNTQVSLGGLVFFHCSASVCVPSATDSCIVNCAQKKKRMADMALQQSLMVTSDGPVIFEDEDFESQNSSEMGRGDIESTSMIWLEGTVSVGCVLAVILVTIIIVTIAKHKRSNEAQDETETCPL